MTSIWRFANTCSSKASASAPAETIRKKKLSYVEAAGKDLARLEDVRQLLGSLPGRKLAGSFTPARRGSVRPGGKASGRQILRWRSRTLPPEKVENPEQAAHGGARRSALSWKSSS